MKRYKEQENVKRWLDDPHMLSSVFSFPQKFLEFDYLGMSELRQKYNCFGEALTIYFVRKIPLKIF